MPKEMPDHLLELIRDAVSLSDARRDTQEGGDIQRAEVDRWLESLKSCSTRDQVRVIAQLRPRSDILSHGLTPMREAALVQLLVTEAHHLVQASDRLKWVGYMLSALATLIAFLQFVGG